jgi:hypothetical protein
MRDERHPAYRGLVGADLLARMSRSRDLETVRLRKIQHPARVERLLDLFVAGANRVPESAYQFRNPSALSGGLQDLVRQARAKHKGWCAWTDDRATWLFTAEMSLALSRERGTPVLEIHAYSEHGELRETGFWAYDKQGIWQRCAD